MKHIIIFLLLTAVASIAGGATPKRVTVIDSADSSAVAGATVISGRGLILGMTDGHGNATYDPARDLPLTIQSIGYEQADLNAACDTLRLIPALYQLGEVSVGTEERPISRVLCYAREYASSATTTDTMQLFSEYMAEMFVAPPKTKGYKSGDGRLRPLNVERYSRLANASGLDSIARPSENDEIVVLSFLEYIAEIPSEPLAENERIAAGATADTIAGKYYAQSIIRKTPHFYTVTEDMLSDHKDHHWSPWFLKLMGITSDFHECSRSLAFAVGEEYDIHSLVSESYNMRFTCTGKLMKYLLHTKDAIDINCYIELYPVDITHHTVMEYKEMRKARNPEPISPPLELPPISPAVANFVARAHDLHP